MEPADPTLRSQCRSCLEDNATRALIWPQVLGINEKDLLDDMKALVSEESIQKIYEKSLQNGNSKKASNSRGDNPPRNSTNTSPPSIASIPSDTSYYDDDVMTSPGPPDPPCLNWEQVCLDVDRSMWNLVLDPREVESQRPILKKIIVAVLRTVRNKEGEPLHYFQGLHDISSVLLLVCGESRAFSILKRLCSTYFLDNMKADMEYTIFQLNMVFKLLEISDSQYFKIIQNASIDSAVFLPWILTWFSHPINNLNTVAKLFDVFLTSHPLMPIYLSCALVMSEQSRVEIYRRGPLYEDIYHYLLNLPAKNIKYDRIIQDSITLFHNTPPHILFSQVNLPLDSCLVSYPYPWVPPDEVIALPLKTTNSYNIKLVLVAASLAFCAAYTWRYFK